MEIKIAHIADLHIGSPCAASGPKSILRRSELKDTFSKILDICTSQDVKVLLIAGDLFDDVDLFSSEVQEIKKLIHKVSFKVVISPGNHDPFTTDSPYNSVWPSNVIIFESNKISFVEVPELNLRLWGSAFIAPYEKTNLLENIHINDDKYINICVMHGNLEGANADVYCPIKISDIEKSKMDYIALGHIHKRSAVCRVGDTFYAYPGCPEGRGFDETGEKGFYIGTVSKGRCNIEFKKTCKRFYEVLNVDITNLSTTEEIIDAVLEKSFEICKNDYKKNLYKVILTGFTEEEFFLDTDKIEFVLNEKVFFAKVVDNTETKINIHQLKYRNDFKSIFIKKMISKINDSKGEYEKAINKKALKIGLAAFCEDVKYFDN